MCDVFPLQIRAREARICSGCFRYASGLPRPGLLNEAKQTIALQIERVVGAGEGIRTLDPDLGKVVLGTQPNPI